MTDDDDQNEPSKSLIRINDLLAIKEKMDISLADMALDGISDFIDEIPKKRGSHIVAGVSFLEGGNFSGSIRVAGRISSKNPVLCENLTIAGNANIQDLIAVRNKTSIAGRTNINGNAIFSGKTSIAGNTNFEENVIVSDVLKIGGTVRIDEQLITDADIKIGGKIFAKSVQSLETISVDGQIFVNGDVKSKEFYLQKGGGDIAGNLIAPEITVGKKLALHRNLSNFEDNKTIANPIELFRYLKYIIGRSLSFRFGKKILEIEGDVIAKDLFLQDTIIHGSINAEKVTIGRNVSVDGMVEYSESLQVENEKEYNVKKIDQSQIKYLNS